MKKEASKEKYVYKTELQLIHEAYEGCCGKPGCKHQMDAYRNHPLPYEPDEDAESNDIGIGSKNMLDNLFDAGYFDDDLEEKSDLQTLVKHIEICLQGWVERDDFDLGPNDGNYITKACTKWLLSHPKAIKDVAKEWINSEFIDEDAESPEDDDIFDDYENDVDFYNSRSSGEDIYDSDMDGFETDDIEEYDDEGNRIESDDLNDDDFIDEVRRLAPGIDEYLENIIDEYDDDYECAVEVVSEFDLPRSKVELIADYVASFRNGDIDSSDDDYSDSYDNYDEENYGYEDEDEEDMEISDSDDTIEPNAGM